MANKTQDLSHLLDKLELVESVSEKSGNPYSAINVYVKGPNRPVRINDRPIFLSDVLISFLESAQTSYEDRTADADASRKEFSSGLDK